MYLRHFADQRKVLHLVDRDDLGRVVPSSVRNACNEVGFYEWRPGLAPEDVEDPAVLAPEYVEHVLLADFEGRAVAPLARMLETGRPPETDEDRYHLSHFIALQATRGRRFREDLAQAGAMALRMSLDSPEGRARSVAWLAERGLPHGRADVDAHLERVLGPTGPRVIPSATYATQQALRASLDVARRLWTGAWHVHRYDHPALLTSDEPVVAWHPGDEPITALTAPVLWFPLSRTHLLAIHWPIGASTARQIVRRDRPHPDHVNSLTATQAERWIVHHPQDGEVLARASVGPRPEWVDEVLDVRAEGDVIHEKHRLRRRPRA
jgi:hypothetical protein